MIRFASEQDNSEVRKLWDLCFGEDKAFNDYFFENIYDAKQNLLLFENDVLCAMTQMLPYELRVEGNIVNATYIYGACTNPNFRRMGHMAKLLGRSFEIDRKEGKKFSFLIPQEKWLYGFYDKFGYKTSFSLKSQKIDCEILDNDENDNAFELVQCGLEHISKINELYEKSFENKSIVIRSYEKWKKQIEMFNNLALGAYCLFENNEIIACCLAWNGEVPFIQEIIAKDDKAFEMILSEFCKKNNVKTIEYNKIDHEIPIAMAKSYSDLKITNGYINLMFN